MTLSIIVIAAAAIVLVHGVLMNELFGEEWFYRPAAAERPGGDKLETTLPPPLRRASAPAVQFDAAACEHDARRHDDLMREAAHREARAESERRAALAEQRQREIDSMFAFALKSDETANSGARPQASVDCGPQSPLNLLSVAAYDDTASPWLPI